MLELLCHGVRRIGRRHTVCSLFLLLAFFTGQPAESNPLGKQQADEDVSDSCKGKANGVCGSNHTSFQWAKTKYGSIAFKAGDCPCGLALESIGDAMPYLPVVFRMLTKRKDYAILVGAACSTIPLAISELVGSQGAVHLFESHPESVQLTVDQNVAAAKNVAILRTRVAVPTEIPADRVWGASPRCLGGYTGTVSDATLLPTPLDRLLPLLHPTLPDSSRHPSFVMIATRPEETLAVLAGAHRMLSSSQPPALLLHCDYDSQAGVMEPITERTVSLLRDRFAYRVWLLIGFHSEPHRDTPEEDAFKFIPPPMHLLAVQDSTAPRALRGASGVTQLVGNLPDESGGYVYEVTASVDLSGDLKRFFLATVGDVERFGMNRRMFFRRIAFDLPLPLRSNLRSVVPFPRDPAPATLLARVSASQFPRDCAQARLLLFKYVNAELSGHGSMFGHLAVALSAAFLSGRTLVVDEHAPWPFADGCMRDDGGCAQGFMRTYFQPISACSTADIGAGERVVPLAPHPQEERVVLVADDTALPEYRTMIPRELGVGTEQQQQLALLNWVATLQSFLLRPSPYLQELVDAERRKMQLPTRYIGMHVRRGHKWVETAPQPLAAYLEMAQNLSETTGIRSVLVTTEDAAAIEEVAASAESMGLSFFHTKNPRPSLRISIPQGIRLGLLSAAVENQVSLVNLVLLRDAEAFIGTFSSGYSKRVLELLAGKQAGFPLHVSLDHVWSP